VAKIADQATAAKGLKDPMKVHFELRQFCVLAVAVAVAVAGVSSLCKAGTVVTVPTSLAPGSQYRLVFATAETYMAVSADIATYNNEVSVEADGVAELNVLGTTWADIGSTSSVNAITNIGLSDPSDNDIPIYNLAGQLVADGDTADAGGIFSGAIDALIDIDELGGIGVNTYAWTGTQGNGTSDPLYELGGLSGSSVIGNENASDSSLLNDGASSQFNLGPLYAISGVLTVATPEPATTGMVLAGVAIMVFARKRSHGNRRANRTSLPTFLTPLNTRRFRR
jgi:hypothetical protein